MGRQADAQGAYDLGQKIMAKTRKGDRVSDTYLAKLNKSNTEKSKKKPALSRDAWRKANAKSQGMGMVEYMQRGGGAGYEKYLKAHKKGPTAPRGLDAINRDWFHKSGQHKLLGQKGATIVFRTTAKTWKETFPHSKGPPKEVWEEWQKSKGQVPGQYTYSTMSYADDYSYNQAKADRAEQARLSKKSRKKSGIGGIIGIGIDMLKTGLRNPKRLLAASPLSAKLWNAITGDDLKPLTTMMGGPSQQSFKDYEKHTGRKVTESQRKFFKIADAVAGVVGGVLTAGALAPLAASAAGGLTAAQVAAGGVQTLGGAIASGATTGAVTGFFNAAGSGTESVSDLFKGAATGGLTGALSGGFGQLSGMSEAAAAKSRAAQVAQAAGGTDMSLWDSATSYFTNEGGGADWGNILGAAGKAASIYGQFQGASAQKSAAKKANNIAQEQYGISRDQSQKQFGLAEDTLALRMAQMQATNQERGQVRGELRSNLKGGRADLSSAYKTSRGLLNRGLTQLRSARGKSRNALQPMIGESDSARMRQMGLLGIAGGDRNATLEQSAGYKFRQEEAMRGAERGLAGTGGSRSGRAAIELQQRSEGLAGQYFDTHMGQLGQFAQAGIGARNNLAGLEQGYGNSLAQAQGGLAGLRTQYGQDRAGQNLGYSQLQAGLVPGSDNFNSQFGQMNSSMGAQAGATAGAVGQSQSNMSNMIGGGMTLLGGAFGQGGIFNSSGGNNSNYNQSSNLGSSQAGYGGDYMNAWAGGQ